MTRPWMAVGGALLVALGLVALALRLSGPASNIVDHATLLEPPEQRLIGDYHRRLLETFDIDYRVVTAASSDDINAYSHQAFGELDVGRASANRRGLLLVIDPASDQVRLEVSAGLEGIFTDAFIAYLEQRQMVPFFEQDRVADGILATSELIFARAQQAAAGFAFDLATAESYSLGGGATTAARLGAGSGGMSWRGGEVAPESTPTATVDAYLAAMAARNARPDLAIYNRATRAMLAQWTVTPAQMDQVARTYRECADRETWIGPDNERAVVRYRPEQRQCAPWFLVREDGQWRLDLAASQHALSFNHVNQWRLTDRDAAGYGFAFKDWRFDRDGFPLASS